VEVISLHKKKFNQDDVNIVWHPHPIANVFERQEFAFPITEGCTVREILIQAGIDPKQPIVVCVDDRLLTVQEWDLICPRQGQLLRVHATVMGGGGISDVFQAVVMIAIAVVAITFVQPEIAALALEMGASAGAASAVGAAAAAVFMIAGAALVSAIFPPQIAAVDTSYNSISYAGNPYSGGGSSARLGMLGIGGSGNGQSTPMYSLSGGNNRVRPYESMIVVMGEHRYFPDAAVRPYTEYQGADQYLYQIFNLGLQKATYDTWQIGTNPIENYSDYVWHDADSTGKITDYPGNVDAGTGGELTNKASWITRTTSDETYKIGLDLVFVMYYANDAGGLDSRSITFTIQYKLKSSSTWLDWGTFTESGNSQSAIRKTYFKEVTKGRYDVRISRSTADSTNSREQLKSTWENIRSYQADNGTYIGQNRRGIVIRASEQLNGTIQQLSAMCHASAYYYDGTSWDWRPTSNPAHWFMHFSHGHRDSDGNLLYGVGLLDSQIDLSLLLSWAQFCDEEGLTFNAVIDGTQTAADIFTAIARTGFGSATWASGKLGVVWDARNASPVAAFGMSNIIRGSFEVAYVTETLAEEVIIQYKNPDNDWNKDEVRVLVPGVTTPTRNTTIDLFGCTDKVMAGKFANYMAAQQYYRRRRITWECDFEGFVCQRGDVVMLSHDLTQWGYSGRIISVDGNTLHLDRVVPRSGTNDYLMLKEPDGTMTTYMVLAGSGESDTITLTSAPTFQSGMLPMDHIWFFSPLPTPGKKVKILSVQPQSESRVKIVATDESEEFYAAWDNTWNEPAQSTLYKKGNPTLTNISVNENLYLGSDSNIHSTVAITWLGSGLYEKADLKYRINSGPWTRVYSLNTDYSFNTTEIGRLDIELVPIYGALQGAPVSFTAQVLGINDPPNDVTSLTDFYRDGRTVLAWRAIIDPRFVEYEVRKGDAWDKAQVLGRVTATEFITDGNGTYWVGSRAGSINGSNPQAIVVDGANLISNVVASYDEEATFWSGSVSGGAKVLGTDITLVGTGLFSAIPVVSSVPSVLYNGGISSSGYYEIPSGHNIDIGHSQACNVSVSYKLRADNPYNLFSRIPLVSDQVSITGNYAGYADCKIQMAIAPDSGVYGAWRDFTPGTYMGRKFKFRANLLSYDTTVTPILDTMSISVDMPDRVESVAAVSCPASGGLTVTHLPAFQISPSVQITILNASPGDNAVLSSQSASGFTVQVTNAGTPVTRNINWLAQGY
jgi:hypothetical protein